MQKILIRKPFIMVFAFSLISYIVTLLLALFFQPARLANVFGYLALLAYIATLLPSILKTVFPNTKGSKILIFLIKNRRFIGITAFILASHHGLLMIVEEKINLLDAYSYVQYFQGITTLCIFTILAITSNDWSVKNLKKNWKNLHQLTYIAIFLLPWHLLDKMSNHWTYLTPFGILITFTTLFLFLKRKWMELVK